MASFTMQVSGSLGSDEMENPSSLHIASIAMFSASTWPSMVLRPSACIFDDHLHEQVAETAPFEVGPHKDGVFAAFVVRVRVQADDAEHVAGRFLDGNEGHGARVVDLRETHDEGVTEFLHRREEPQTQ